MQFPKVLFLLGFLSAPLGDLECSSPLDLPAPFYSSQKEGLHRSSLGSAPNPSPGPCSTLPQPSDVPPGPPTTGFVNGGEVGGPARAEECGLPACCRNPQIPGTWVCWVCHCSLNKPGNGSAGLRLEAESRVWGCCFYKANKSPDGSC